MHSEDRRSFVKKSLATSVAISFTGLIRAHGEGGGETTTSNPEETTYATTDSGGTTTWNPDFSTIATTLPEETTWNPEETTTPPTTEDTTIETTHRDSKKRRWKCKRTVWGPHNGEYTQDELDEADYQYNSSHPNPWGEAPEGPPTGSNYISGPETLEFWPGARPTGISMSKRRENGPTMSNWKDPATGQYYAAYLYDYIEEEFPPSEGGND